MAPPAPPSYAGYRFPAEIISYAVWLYFRFPLSLRHADEILAARGIVVSHETVRQWGLKFGQAFANRIRRRLLRCWLLLTTAACLLLRSLICTLLLTLISALRRLRPTSS